MSGRPKADAYDPCLGLVDELYRFPIMTFAAVPLPPERRSLSSLCSSIASPSLASRQLASGCFSMPADCRTHMHLDPAGLRALRTLSRQGNAKALLCRNRVTKRLTRTGDLEGGEAPG